jgi:hypothetical protein
MDSTLNKFNKLKYSKIFLYCIYFIFFIAIFFRLNSISNVPPSPSLDEVSIGYNANSILKTGMDEYGNKFPLLLRAYDDWRPAFYVYLVIPCIKVFGLSVEAVRMPSVFLSLLSIVIGFNIISLLTKKLQYSNYYVVFSMFLFSLSPWHIYLSRLGHEANLGFFSIVFGVWLFLLYIFEKKGIALILSSIVFALSLNTYQSQKIIAPLTVLFLGILYRKELLKNTKIFIISIIIGLIIAFPIVQLSLTPDARVRFEKTNVMKYHQSVLDAWDRYTIARQNGDIFGKIVNNPKLVGVEVVIKQYFLHFNPYWLFYFSTKPEDHKIPGLGLLLFWELPLCLYGTYMLQKEKKYSSFKYVLLGMVLISPIPGAITTQAPHAMRSFTMVPWIQFIGAIGGVEFLLLFKKRYQNYLHYLNFFVIVLAFFTIGYVYHQYFIDFPKIDSFSFQYGLNTMLTDTTIHLDSYDAIYMSNEGNLYQSYMFYLFQKNINPYLYQLSGGTKSGGYAVTHTINNVHFEPIHIKNDQVYKKVLYVGNPFDIPVNTKPLKTYYSLDGTPAVVIFET